MIQVSSKAGAKPPDIIKCYLYSNRQKKYMGFDGNKKKVVLMKKKLKGSKLNLISSYKGSE